MSVEAHNPLTVFEAERPRLTGVAYRMLGSAVEAEDVLQDVWLRWSTVDHATVDNPAAYLTTVTSRLALDRLKSAQRRREQYVGPWLPEPVATSPDTDPESTAVLAESVMLGFLAVLERLGPLERAVFILREVFDTPYSEVAAIVERSEDNCRQLARRAREHVRAERQRVPSDLSRDRALIDAFVQTIATGDASQLEQLLHDDVVLVADSGGLTRAARRPIIGAARVSRFLLGLAQTASDREVNFDYVLNNGQVSLLLDVDGYGQSLFTVEPVGPDNLVRRIYVQRNPEKLQRIVSSENR